MFKNNIMKKVRASIYARQVDESEGSSSILDVSIDASAPEIASAYRRMASALHPDVNTNPTHRQLFDKLTQAYEELKRTSPKPMLRLHPYHNTKTFVHLNNSLSIPKTDLLVLDGYGFSVAELSEYAEANLNSFYRNPHIMQADENKSFSEVAIQKLRQHPHLMTFAKSLDTKLALQTNGISERTIDEVLTLVKKIHAGVMSAQENGNENFPAVEQAEIEFGRYFFTLPADEQRQLNAYCIYLNDTSGGSQNLTFEAALIGGDVVTRCTNIQRVYLWQFIIDFRPEEFRNIPHAIIQMTEIDNLQIKPRITYMNSRSYSQNVERLLNDVVTLLDNVRRDSSDSSDEDEKDHFTPFPEEFLRQSRDTLESTASGYPDLVPGLSLLLSSMSHFGFDSLSSGPGFFAPSSTNVNSATTTGASNQRSLSELEMQIMDAMFEESMTEFPSMRPN